MWSRLHTFHSDHENETRSAHSRFHVAERSEPSATRYAHGIAVRFRLEARFELTEEHIRDCLSVVRLTFLVDSLFH
jgi:hypothetical protein